MACPNVKCTMYDRCNHKLECATFFVEVQPNSIQQLKAEIAAIAENLHFAYEAADMDYKTIAESIEQLRQLSAV